MRVSVLTAPFYRLAHSVKKRCATPLKKRRATWVFKPRWQLLALILPTMQVPEQLFSKNQVVELLLKAIAYVKTNSLGDDSSAWKDYANTVISVYSDEMVFKLPYANVIVPIAKKYPGMTIAQIYCVNQDYVSWLLGLEDCEIAHELNEFNNALSLINKAPLKPKKTTKRSFPALSAQQLDTLTTYESALHVITFGKYSSLKLYEIFNIDRTYFYNYLLVKADDDTRERCREFSKALENVGIFPPSKKSK